MVAVVGCLLGLFVKRRVDRFASIAAVYARRERSCLEGAAAAELMAASIDSDSATRRAPTTPRCLTGYGQTVFAIVPQHGLG